MFPWIATNYVYGCTEYLKMQVDKVKNIREGFVVSYHVMHLLSVAPGSGMSINSRLLSRFVTAVVVMSFVQGLILMTY